MNTPTVQAAEPTVHTSASFRPSLEDGHEHNYGLNRAVLTPLETLAQSIAGIAPSATPAMLVPLVFAFAGAGTCLCYLIATVGVIFVAAAINQFSKRSASPGSLYSFVDRACGHKLGLLTGWSMLFAYVFCGAACAVEFSVYAKAVIAHLTNAETMAIVPVVACVLAVGYVAYKNIKLSATLMLRLEFFSISLILILVALILFQYGLQVDLSQIFLKGVSPEQVRLGLVLAIFGFVGFESAASLGVEATDPLRTIPAAITRSVFITGLFFVVTSYALVLGFSMAHLPLDKSSTPLFVLSQQSHVPILGILIDIGVMVSFFAAALANLNAGSRTLFFMGHHGVFHASTTKAHGKNATPHISIFAISALGMIPAVVLVAMHFELMDIIGWLGTLATYGFIFAYIAVSIAAVGYVRSLGQLTALNLSLAIASIAIMCLALFGTFYPVPPAPYNWLPLVFVAYILIGGIILISRHKPLRAD